MGLAVLEQRKPGTALKKGRTYQLKGRKKKGPAGGKSRQKHFDFDLGAVLKMLAEGTAKAILIAACSYGILAGYRFVTSSPHFNVNQVNWVGQQRLSNADLTSWVGPIVGGNIFQLDLNAVSVKLAEHPWVRTASARRIFPQGLHIELKERIPFARIQLNQVYVIDNYGILLAPEEKSFDGLPFITGIQAKDPSPGQNVANEEIIRGLKTMYYFNRLPMFERNPIDTLRISNQSRITFVTKSRGMEVHMRQGTAQESFKNLMLVLDTIGENEKDLSYIDLSFKNKMVVKHRKNVKKNSPKTKKT
jgi:cell division protein FtsQ